MTRATIATQRRASKPDKPSPEFPLFAHATGRWAKKIKGRLFYFGPWADPQSALDRYLREREYLYAGRKPPADDSDAPTVRDLFNNFLTAKRAQHDAGELTGDMFACYFRAAERAVKAFGGYRRLDDLTPDDFAGLRNLIVKGKAPTAAGKEIQLVRTAMKWAYDSAIIERPMRLGPGFSRPSAKTIRLDRAKRVPMLFTAPEIRAMLTAVADPQLKAMVLLGINCGYGPTDLAQVTLDRLDLSKGMATFPRPKTGIARECPLWPQTVKAIREAVKTRPTPRDDADAGLVFITRYGKPWVRHKLAEDDAGRVVSRDVNSVSLMFGRLLVRMGIKRGRVNHYGLRHTLATVGEEAGKPAALARILGHEHGGIMEHYREGISPDALRAVTDHVQRWLFGKRKR